MPEIELQRHPDTGELIPEEWIDIVNYEGLYQISNYGRVKSNAKRCKSFHYGANAIMFINRKERILKPGSTPNGYAVVSLCKEGKYGYFSIHKLVSVAFLPNPKKYPQINHKNANKKDNRSLNLEWCTPVQNKRHALHMGLIKTTYAPMNVDKVKAIRADAAILSVRKLAKKYKSNEGTIGDVVRNRTWKNL